METILLVQSEAVLSAGLARLLSGVGYVVSRQADLTGAAATLLEQPSLVLLDLELAADGGATWDHFAEGCQLAEIPCLGYTSNGMCPEEMTRLLPWGESLLRPEQDKEVLRQVACQLQVRGLLRERELLQGRLLEKQQELDAGLRSAATIQQSLLPSQPPANDRFDFAWRFIPCQRVGGDLLNVQRISDKQILVYLLDVSGHGVSSAMVTVSVYQSLSLHTGRIVKRPLDVPPYFEIPGPAQVLEALEREYPFERFEKFFTISYLLLDLELGTVRFANGGHPPPLLLHRDGRRELLDAGGSLIGLGGLVPFSEGQVKLSPGDRIFLYSDGVTEHADAGGAMFGAERFFRLLEEGGAQSLDDVCESILGALTAFGKGGALADDLSLLGMECRG